jgi:hypothetical protein
MDKKLVTAYDVDGSAFLQSEELDPSPPFVTFAAFCSNSLVSDGSKQRAIMPTDESEEKFEQKEAKVTKEIGIGCC